MSLLNQFIIYSFQVSNTAKKFFSDNEMQKKKNNSEEHQDYKALASHEY